MKLVWKTEMPERNAKPLLGRDIPWEQVEGEFLRVVYFAAFGTVEQGRVKAFSAMAPYASLDVECPVLEQCCRMYVTHRVDFLHLWQAWKERTTVRTN